MNGEQPMSDQRARTFTSQGWFQITGRGWCANIDAAQMPDDLWEPNDLKGQTVTIDGKEYVVKGVESFCIMRGPGHPYRLPFSLLIGER